MFPGRRELLPGRCGCLSEHPLPLQLWVCELYGWKNDLNYLSEINALHFWCLDRLFPHFGRLCEKKYPKLAAYYNCHRDRPSIKATAPSACPKNPGADGVLTGIWADDAVTQYKVGIRVLWTKLINLLPQTMPAVCFKIFDWQLKRTLRRCALAQGRFFFFFYCDLVHLSILLCPA